MMAAGLVDDRGVLTDEGRRWGERLYREERALADRDDRVAGALKAAIVSLREEARDLEDRARTARREADKIEAAVKAERWYELTTWLNPDDIESCRMFHPPTCSMTLDGELPSWYRVDERVVGDVMFTIRHKRQGWIAACGFGSIDRARAWLANFDPRMWDDKTLKATDFEIVRK